MSDMTGLAITLEDDEGKVRFEVQAKPRARKSAIVGLSQGRLAVAIAAPPVDGAANEELVRFLAKALAVRKSDVTIERGEGGRVKLVAVAGIDASAARTRLAGT